MKGYDQLLSFEWQDIIGEGIQIKSHAFDLLKEYVFSFCQVDMFIHLTIQLLNWNVFSLFFKTLFYINFKNSILEFSPDILFRTTQAKWD